MKYKYKSAILVIGILFSLTPGMAHANSDAVNALKDATGDRELGCKIQETGKYQPAPPFVELKIVTSTQTKDDVIFATAHYLDANYSVDSDKIENGTLFIAMSNNIDGPHSEDRLEIPLSELDQLKANPNSEIHGSDHYSEDEDGTSTVLQMACELE